MLAKPPLARWFVPGHFFVLLFLGSLVALASMSTDLFLPSLPAIAHEFGTTYTKAQLTISIYFMFYASIQIIHGPLSDALGRKPILLLMVLLYILSSALCSFAPSIDILIMGRAVQAMAAAAPMVMVRAIVRDVFDNKTMPRVFANIAAIFALFPLIAPLLGGQVDHLWGWRATFDVMAAFGVIVFLLSLFVLPETHKKEHRQSIQLFSILRSYVFLFQQKIFIGNVILALFSFAGFFVFLTCSPHVLQQVHHMDPRHYSYVFVMVALGFAGATLLVSRSNGRIRSATFMMFGAFFFLACAVLQILTVLAHWGVPGIVIATFSCAIGVGLSLPQASAKAMSSFPHIAGTASALIGCIQILGAALIGNLSAMLVIKHPSVMLYMIAGCSFMGFCMILVMRKTNEKADGQAGVMPLAASSTSASKMPPIDPPALH